MIFIYIVMNVVIEWDEIYFRDNIFGHITLGLPPLANAEVSAHTRKIPTWKFSLESSEHID